MAQGGTQTITGNAAGTNYATILSLGGNITFWLDNRATTAGAVFLNITNFHDASDAIPVPVGVTYYKTSPNVSPKNVQLKGDGVNASTVAFGVAAKV